MFKILRKVKQKTGNIMIPVLGTLLALSIMAVSIVAYSQNAVRIVRRDRNSMVSNARNILYICTNYFCERINTDGVSGDGDYRAELISIYEELDITKKTITNGTAYYLYYPIAYNDAGEACKWLRTKVIPGETQVEDDETDDTAEQGSWKINDTMFDEQKKIDEKYNVTNMGSLFLIEQGLLPKRVTASNQLSTVEGDIDNFDEAFSYASNSATLLIDSMAFSLTNNTGSSDPLGHLKDASGELMLFYETGDLGGNYYWRDVDGNSGRVLSTTATQTKAYRQSYDLESLRALLASLNNTTVAKITFAEDNKSNPPSESSYTFDKSNDSHTLYYKLNGSDKTKKWVSSRALAEDFANYYYKLYKSEYSDSDLINIMKRNLVLDAIENGILKNDNFLNYAKAEAEKEYKIDNGTAISNIRNSYTSSGYQSVWQSLQDKSSYEVNNVDDMVTITFTDVYRKWNSSGNMVDQSIEYTAHFYFNKAYVYEYWLIFARSSHQSLYTTFTTGNYGYSPISGTVTDEMRQRAISDILGYQYNPTTTVANITGNFGSSNSQLEGYKESAIATALARHYINSDIAKDGINGYESPYMKSITKYNAETGKNETNREAPTSIMIRTFDYTAEYNNNFKSSWVKGKLVVYTYYSDGSYKQQNQIENQNWTYFQTLSFNPTNGATYNAATDTFTPAIICKDGNYNALAPITTINNIGRNFEGSYGKDVISANGEQYPATALAGSSFTDSKTITSNTKVNGDVTINTNATIDINNKVTTVNGVDEVEYTSLYINGDLNLNAGEDKLINFNMEPGSFLYIKGDLNITYSVTGWDDLEYLGVNMNCNGANIMVDGNVNYQGYKRTYLLLGILTSQTLCDSPCNSHQKITLKDTTIGTEAEKQVAIAYNNEQLAKQDKYAEEYNCDHPNEDVKSLLAGTYVINGDLIFNGSFGSYSNPTLNGTFYVDGICDMTGLWTEGLYDRCRPNFIFARVISQPTVAWATVFPSFGSLSEVMDTWCQTNGYLFIISEDAIDFSALNFASVNIHTPYDLLNSDLEAANRAQWNMTEEIDKDSVTMAYCDPEMDLWGLPSILRTGLGQMFAFEPIENGNATVVTEKEGNTF